METLLQISSPTSESVQQKAVIELISRLLPKRVDEFEIVINTQLLKDDFKDKFIVSSKFCEFCLEFEIRTILLNS
jgi:hypothetical protein